MESLLLSSHIVMSLKKTGESVFNRFGLGLELVLLNRVTEDMWLLACLQMQIWKCNCGGEHREGLAGSHFPKDTNCVWFWNLRFSKYYLCCRIFHFLFKRFCFFFFQQEKIIGLAISHERRSVFCNDFAN